MIGGDDDMIGSIQVLNILSRYRFADRFSMREYVKSDLTDMFGLSNTQKKKFPSTYIDLEVLKRVAGTHQ